MESILKGKRRFFAIGAAAAFGQILLVMAGIAVIGLLGKRPESAQEAMDIFSRSAIEGLLRDEILTVFMISLYFFSATALFAALYESHPVLSVFSLIFTFAAAIMIISSNSAFSLLHLSREYSLCETAESRQSIVTAAHSVISRNMWNGTSAYFSGIFLQGAGIMISFAMLKSGKFAPLAGISGIICNGLDLLQHLLHYSVPEAASIVLYLAGPFYLLWYVLTGTGLIKLAKQA
ncbi:MAG: hypothetical protein JXN65_01935 [Clostridia bacterium]|nr:hypothetical protein [Clostridia bacterium]